MTIAKPTIIKTDDPADRKGELKQVGGSTSNAFNNVLANSVTQALWFKNSDASTQIQQLTAAVAALTGIAPRDELEGMLAGQLIAANAAAMECYRRAMLGEQTFEGRKENLTQASKLSRTYVTLLEALNRHRGKGGQQKVTVEHVHVHAGGQAVVGAVQTGGGASHETGEQPHAKAIGHAPEPPLWSQDQEQDPVPGAGDAQRPMPHARWRVTRSAKG